MGLTHQTTDGALRQISNYHFFSNLCLAVTHPTNHTNIFLLSLCRICYINHDTKAITGKNRKTQFSKK
jgi:hypothetical protein